MCGIHIGSRQQRLVDILSVACIVHLVGQHVDLRLSRLASDAKTQSQQRDHSGAAQLSKTVRTHGCPLHELLRNYANPQRDPFRKKGSHRVESIRCRDFFGSRSGEITVLYETGDPGATERKYYILIDCRERRGDSGAGYFGQNRTSIVGASECHVNDESSCIVDKKVRKTWVGLWSPRLGHRSHASLKIISSPSVT